MPKPNGVRLDTRIQGVYVLIDPPVKYSTRMSSFEGCYATPTGTPVRWVHVISENARGEVLGYALLDDGSLRVRLPNYAGHWPEMHAEVVRVVTEHATGQKTLPGVA